MQTNLLWYTMHVLFMQNLTFAKDLLLLSMSMMHIMFPSNVGGMSLLEMHVTLCMIATAQR